jgi:hypothetical protein
MKQDYNRILSIISAGTARESMCKRSRRGLRWESFAERNKVADAGTRSLAKTVQAAVLVALLTLGIGLVLSHPAQVRRFFFLPGSGETEREKMADYPDCRAARAAGAAPIRMGEPGYRPKLDSDGNGIACEPNRDR